MLNTDFEERRRIPRVSALFSIYVSLMPVLQYYKSPIPGLNISTFFAVLFFVYFIVDIGAKKKIVVEKKLLPVRIYWIFITINVVITSCVYKYSLSFGNLSAYIRLSVLIIGLLLLGNKHFNLEYAIKTLRALLVTSAIIILFQDLLYYGFSVAFKPIISNMLMDSGYAKINGRFSGLFMEPSHYAQAAILFLCISLFDFENYFQLKHKRIVEYIVIGGIVLSGSGQGYLLLAVALIIYMFISMKVNKWSTNRMLLAITGLVFSFVMLVFLSRLEVIQFALSRLYDDNGNIGGIALVGRTFTNVFFDELSGVGKWVGIGFGHIESLTGSFYRNSLYYYLIQCGYLSIPILLFMLVYYFIKGNVACKVFLILYSIMIYFASTAAPADLCFYMSFVIKLVADRYGRLEYEQPKYD